MSRFVDEIYFIFRLPFDVFLLSSKFSIIIMMIMIMIIKRSDHKFNDMINSKFTHTHKHPLILFVVFLFRFCPKGHGMMIMMKSKFKYRVSHQNDQCVIKI